MGNTCVDESVTSAGCKKHVEWAMQIGFSHHPSWYIKQGANENSSFEDFQCALWKMRGGRVEGDSHECRRPCDSSLPGCKITPLTVNTEAPTEAPEVNETN